MNVHAEVRRTIGKYRMIAPGQTVLVAASGGPDSMALLYMLHSLQSELGCRLAVAHFNHLTRGAASDADQELVEDMAGNLGIACYVGRYDVPGAVRPGSSLQVVAREMRYRFFRETASRAGAARVALGHQADDQAETVLQNMLRGSGTTGLRGIPPCRDIFVRPLIEVRRADIMSFLKTSGLPYRDDASNFKTVYTRNRVRLELIPFLESGYNPRVVETLNRLAAICREDEEFLENQAQAAFGRISSRTGPRLLLDLGALAELPGALSGRVVRTTWEELRGRPGDLSYVQVRAVMSLATRGQTGGVVQLPGGVRVTRTYTHLSFGWPPDGIPEGINIRRLDLPGRTPLPELDLAIAVAFPPSPPSWRELPPTEAVLDYDRTGGELFVRRRVNGDLFWPMGLPGRIKLKKFFIDRKVPREERDRVPLVCTPDDIVWVAGIAPGYPYRVTENTRRFLHLRLEDPV
ncbi:MAG TPA: tRNA lysidine(34) synthetase TilS [Spirochaetia bacterium]|nr:tRNA lysidine(34) synthetase TilS [Spirochaetia bacterium]